MRKPLLQTTAFGIGAVLLAAGLEAFLVWRYGGDMAVKLTWGHLGGVLMFGAMVVPGAYFGFFHRGSRPVSVLGAMALGVIMGLLNIPAIQFLASAHLGIAALVALPMWFFVGALAVASSGAWVINYRWSHG
jgi:hypothetical protein